MKKNLLYLFILMSASFAKAQVGNSLSFDGTNDNIRRGVVSVQNTAVTYEARIRAAAASAGNKYIMYNGTNGTNGFGLYLQASTNTVVVKVGASVYTSSYVVPTGSLTLLSIVFTGPNGLQVYANGTIVHNFFPPPATAPSGSFAIGSDDVGANFFGGEIDEVRYWNRIVCASEILHRSTCQANGNEPMLVACYNFNQGVGAANNATVTTLMDSSPSNYTATLTGFALTGVSSNWLTIAGAFSSNCTMAPATVTIAPAGGTVTTCSGSPINLIGSGATTYTWNTSQTGATLALTPSATVQYSVLAQSGFCYGMGLKTVSVNPKPTVGVSSSTAMLCVGSSATLTSTGATTYTWMPTGTGSNIVVSPTTTSTYTVIGTDVNTCTNIAVITQSTMICPVGIMQLTNNVGLSIYPNPANGIFTIAITNSSQNTKLEIYNAIGQLVLSEDVKDHLKINIEQIPNGVYIVRLKENNAVIKTTKLIKE